MDEDDDDPAPSWIATAYELSLQLEKLIRNTERCIRISTIRPTKRSVIDRWLWVRGHAPASRLFMLSSPRFPVPEGWRFAFGKGACLGWNDIAHLRVCNFSHLIKIQVLEVPESVGDHTQIAFNPESARVIAEFLL